MLSMEDLRRLLGSCQAFLDHGRMLGAAYGVRDVRIKSLAEIPDLLAVPNCQFAVRHYQVRIGGGVKDLVLIGEAHIATVAEQIAAERILAFFDAVAFEDITAARFPFVTIMVLEFFKHLSYYSGVGRLRRVDTLSPMRTMHQKALNHFRKGLFESARRHSTGHFAIGQKVALVRQVQRALKNTPLSLGINQPDIFALEKGFQPGILFTVALTLGFPFLGLYGVLNKSVRDLLGIDRPIHPRQLLAQMEAVFARLPSLEALFMHLPLVSDMVHRRNETMVRNLIEILKNPGYQTVAAGVGAAHIPGMEKLLFAQLDIAPGSF